ncbi:MAG: DUF58 domain-containing protein [Armatimonadaceae bacterium]
MESKLLTPEFLQQLERLSATAKRPFPGRMKGEKRSPRRGSSVEFADYREYIPGDDLRYVDWKAYARLERLFLKLFVEEEDLSIHLVVDASQSMDYPTEPADRPTKFLFASRVAAALGYVGLIRYDRVGIAGFGQALGRRAPVLRGRNSVPQFFGYLEEMKPGGTTDFTAALRHYAMRHSQPGICVVLSDFMDPQWEQGVRSLLAARFQIVLLHILDPDEAEPKLAGDLRLVDSETGEAREISISPEMLAAYREAFERFCGQLSEVAARYGMDYVRVTTDTPLDDLLLRTLRATGLLR